MKIAIITSRYPSKNNPYNHMFVHTRSLFFIKEKNVQLKVYVPSETEENYTFDNVKVIKTSALKIAKEILNFDIVYIHLLNIYPKKMIDGWLIYKSIIENNVTTAMYLHGSEVQRYESRSFDYDFSIKESLKFFYKNFYFIPKMRKFIKSIKNRKNVIFLAPSKWMIEEAEKNLLLKLNNYKIIPNGIDTNLFKFIDSYENRYKLLTIRPLSSNKYAVDIAIKIMKYLPPIFKLDIYGEGKLRKKLESLIKKYNLEDRVRIINKFIDRKDLPNVISKYGIALMPTRMDAQGVTMCEMMSPGLLTVSSYSSAIPEFIIDEINGVLFNNNNPKNCAEKIIKIVGNKKQYQQICINARKSMENINIYKTLKKELDILKSIAK